MFLQVRADTPLRGMWQGKSYLWMYVFLTLQAPFTSFGASVFFVKFFASQGFLREVLIVLPSGSFLKQRGSCAQLDLNLVHITDR